MFLKTAVLFAWGLHAVVLEDSIVMQYALSYCTQKDASCSLILIMSVKLDL